MLVDVIIPALDEAAMIGDVVRALPRPPVREIVVVDNGSRDGGEAGARLEHYRDAVRDLLRGTIQHLK